MYSGAEAQPMREAAFLMVWLAGLFGLVGLVIAAVARLVRRDTIDYDRRFIWRTEGQPIDEQIKKQ
jgi:hypothetical protein